ncbi:MAG TPA: LysR substrate-binding domain-containing protein [Pyrinomonadaceae bacterium]
MNLRQIKYFLSLADELHFWRTSEKMFITQSALSRHIKGLEQELGLKLFERDKRNVRLTAAGEFLREEYKKLVGEFESVSRHARQIAAGEVGSLRVGHPASITFSVLPEILLALSRKHPQITAQMFELMATDFDAALLGYHIDAGFNREPGKAAGLASKELLRENFALVVPARHRLAVENKIDLREVENEWFVLPSLAGKSEHVEQLRAIFDRSRFAPKVRYESDFGATLLGLVAKGLGISLMPFSYSHHSPPGVRFIKIEPTTSLYLIWRRRDENAALRNFLEVVQNFVAE